MTKAIDDAVVEELTHRYRVSDALSEHLRLAMEDAQRNPVRAERVYELINRLAGKSEAEQRRIISEIEQLLKHD